MTDPDNRFKEGFRAGYGQATADCQRLVNEALVSVVENAPMTEENRGRVSALQHVRAMLRAMLKKKAR